jgi:hypothetical protein
MGIREDADDSAGTQFRASIQGEMKGSPIRSIDNRHPFGDPADGLSAMNALFVVSQQQIVPLASVTDGLSVRRHLPKIHRRALHQVVVAASVCLDHELTLGGFLSDRLAESHLVEHYQLPPGAFRVGHAVNRPAAIRRHFLHTPTVLRWIHFDLRRHVGCGKGFPQLVLRVRLAHVVIRRDTEIHLPFDLRRKQLRAVGLVGDKTTAVKGGGCRC